MRHESPISFDIPIYRPAIWKLPTYEPDIRYLELACAFPETGYQSYFTQKVLICFKSGESTYLNPNPLLTIRLKIMLWVKQNAREANQN